MQGGRAHAADLLQALDGVRAPARGLHQGAVVEHRADRAIFLPGGLLAPVDQFEGDRPDGRVHTRDARETLEDRLRMSVIPGLLGRPTFLPSPLEAAPALQPLPRL